MISLIASIVDRLRSSAYVNEAAVSHEIVIPVLAELGWDTADPRQVQPEFSNERGRVDFALFDRARRPIVFVEVKACDTHRSGRSLADRGDKQLFEYAFHDGVPLCLLTDGREWRFYLPSGQGRYEDRLLYALQIDERAHDDSETILRRYLDRERVLSGVALDEAFAEHRKANRTREANRNLPRAWEELVNEGDSDLIDLLREKTAALCGYEPSDSDTLRFLEGLRGSAKSTTPMAASPAAPTQKPELPSSPPVGDGQGKLQYTLLGKSYAASNANQALVQILTTLADTDPSRIELLSDQVKTPKLCHVARSAEEINPARPDLARPQPISEGWYVNLGISNYTKMRIIQAAAEIYGLNMPQDLDISLPNA